MITNGAFGLERNPTGGQVYEDGELIGYYWQDKYDDKLAVFQSGRSRPIARLKTAAGAIRRITGGRWDGTGEPSHMD